MNASRVSLAAALILLLAACSGSTIYRLTIDGLSFIEEQERSGSVSIPADTVKYLYFLPDYGQFDQELSTSISAELRHGFLVEYPAPQLPDSSEGELELLIRAIFEITHTSGSGDISGSAAVYIAEEETENIYSGGQKVAESSSAALAVGQKETLSLEAKLQREDPAFDLIDDGAFRCGVEVSLNGDLSSSTQVNYSMKELFIRLEARPFSFIP